jgi:hypothetical protein
MSDTEPTVAITVRVSAATHQALQRLAQQEHRSLAGQAAYLLEHALAVEQRVRQLVAAERAEHWARQARGLGGGAADTAPAGGADNDEARERARRVEE